MLTDKQTSNKEKDTESTNKLVFNVLNTQYDVIKNTGVKMGFQLSSNDDEEWDLYWYDLGITSDRLLKMKQYQKINHFPGMNGIAKKNHLGRNLNKMRRAYPNEYNFYPETWLLPTDLNELKANQNKNRSRMYIIKPEGLAQGQGIFLTTDFEQIGPSDHYVAQRYLTKPYLINGLKFDMRIYVLVYGCDPLRIYIFKEGLARFCTEPYTKPQPGNMTNLYMHLTNYAINKHSDKYIFNSDPNKTNVGHKRSITSIWKHIDENGGNSLQILQKIKNGIVKTLIALQPQLAHIYHSCQPNDLKNDKCFEILGFDVILDHKLKPIILEVNQAPSFNIDSPFDESVKSSLLKETFTILNMNIKHRVNYYSKLKIENEEKLYKARHQKYTKEQRIEKLKKHMEKRDTYEKKCLNEFTLIYPDANSNYEELLEGARNMFLGISNAKKRNTESAIETDDKEKLKEKEKYQLNKAVAPPETKEEKKATKPLYDMSKVKSRYMDIKVKSIEKKGVLQYLNDSLGVNGEEIDYIEKQLIGNMSAQQSPPQYNIPSGKQVFKAAADQIINPMITNFMYKEESKHRDSIAQKDIRQESKPRYENYSYRQNKQTNESSRESEAMSDLLRVQRIPLERAILDSKQRSVPKITSKR